MVVRGFVLVSRDSGGLDAGVSGVVRLWEEYGVGEVVFVVSRSFPVGRLERLEWWARRFVGSVGSVRVDTGVEGGGGLVGELYRLFSRDCVDSVVLVSGGGRFLASAAALAGVRASMDCRVDVVHVHFYFGPWNGLVYPYTPLRLQPLVVLHPVLGPRPSPSSGAGRAPELHFEGGGVYCRHPVWGERRLPPLRCAVAELARRVNVHLRPGVVAGEVGGCGKLRVEVGGSSLGGADLCREGEVANLAGRLARRVLVLEELGLGYPVRSALAWSGLAHLRGLLPDGSVRPLPELVFERTMIVDTVLVYYGAHRYAWEGGRLMLPECAVREVHGRLAESIKRGKARSGEAIADVLAYLALEDLLGAGVPVAPTPTGKCDTAIPKMDPVILEDKILATADDGAHRYWLRHPSRRLAVPVKVFFDPEEAGRQEVDPERDPLSLSRLYYSLYQILLFYALLDSQCVEGAHPLRIYVDSGEGEVEVRPPTGLLLKAAGLEPGRCGKQA